MVRVIQRRLVIIVLMLLKVVALNVDRIKAIMLLFGNRERKGMKSLRRF